jgi:adenylosuccinate synthase
MGILKRKKDEATAHIVIGLGYGDEGKGHMVDYLCRKHNAKLVVRFSGGPQSTHTVYTKDGMRHSFAQVGAGSFITGVNTYLSQHTMVEPFALLNECRALYDMGLVDIRKRIMIDPDCIIITPFHWIANRLMESARGDKRYGSCGFGLGECKADSLQGFAVQARDLSATSTTLRSSLCMIKEKKVEETRIYADTNLATKILFESLKAERVESLLTFYALFSTLISIDSKFLFYPQDSVVFEGSQGILLDEEHGFNPYTTWSDTTAEKALSLLGSHSQFNVEAVGVTRAYMTRHGAGPFVSEGYPIQLPEPDNKTGDWQGSVRRGYLDTVALRYSLKCAGRLDSIAVTHCDSVPQDNYTYCHVYQTPTISETKELPSTSPEDLNLCRPLFKATGKSTPELLEEELGVKVKYVSYGPTAEDIEEAYEY